MRLPSSFRYGGRVEAGEVLLEQAAVDDAVRHGGRVSSTTGATRRRGRGEGRKAAKAQREVGGGVARVRARGTRVRARGRPGPLRPLACPRGERPGPRRRRAGPRRRRAGPRRRRAGPSRPLARPRGERPGPRRRRPGPRGERPGPRGERPGPRGERPGPRRRRPGPRRRRPGPCGIPRLSAKGRLFRWAPSGFPSRGPPFSLAPFERPVATTPATLRGPRVPLAPVRLGFVESASR